MTEKHTAKTLAKYLGMEVFIANFHNGVVGTIEEIRYRTDSVGIKLKNDSFIWSDRIWNHQENNPIKMYPILKTVEDLTDEDKKYVYYSGVELNEDFQRLNKQFDVFELVSLYEGNRLLTINSGAILCINSPTNYISIHDNLPCILWREDGRYLV